MEYNNSIMITFLNFLSNDCVLQHMKQDNINLHFILGFCHPIFCQHFALRDVEKVSQLLNRLRKKNNLNFESNDTLRHDWR